jgi:glutaredoxin 3
VVWPFTGREGGDGQNILPDGKTVHLALYKYDSCPYCQLVFRMIDKTGARVEYRDIRRDPRWRADLMRMNGMTQVPCLVIDGEPMLESADINQYLKERFGAAR